MNIKRTKKLLAFLLSAVMAVTALPGAALAVETDDFDNVGGYNYANYNLTDQELGTYTKIQEGVNQVGNGNGTITLDSANCTLTLENVNGIRQLHLQDKNEFTVIFKGINTIGDSMTSSSNSSGLINTYCVSKLNIIIEKDAVLNLEANNTRSCILVSTGSLYISGAGTLNASGIISDVNIIKADNDLSVAGISGTVKNNNSRYSPVFASGNISIENADLTIEAEICVDGGGICIPSSGTGNISIKNSKLNITSGDRGLLAYGASSAVTIENSEITIYADYYGIEANGNITFSGDDTKVSSNDTISSKGNISISVKELSVSTTKSRDALYAENDLTISKGTITASAKSRSAIASNKGKLSITGGTNTQITATNASWNEGYATITNRTDGGIYLDAVIEAVNSSSGRPIEGRLSNESVAITIGESFEAKGMVIHTEDISTSKVLSYFTTTSGDKASQVNISKHDHTWGNWQNNGNSTHSRTCSTCNETETENCSGGIATCTQKAVCEVCGQEYGELAAHKYGSWIIVKDSTYSETGLKKRVCSECGDEITEVIPVKHKISDTVTIGINGDSKVKTETEANPNTGAAPKFTAGVLAVAAVFAAVVTFRKK